MPEIEPPEYVVERLRVAIATEPDVHELGIDVQVSGRNVLLSGSVASPAQRDAIHRLVERLVGDLDVIDELDVPSTDPPRQVEEL